MGHVIRTINPSADMTKGTLSKHVIAHARLREERQAAITGALSLLVDKPIAKAFDLDDLGFTTIKTVAGGTKKVHINDLIEGSQSAYRLSAEQKAAVKIRKDIWDDLTFDYNRFSKRQLDTESGLFPRTVAGRIDQSGKLRSKSDSESFTTGGGSKVKVTGGFTRARAMKKDGTIYTTEEMIKRGWRYADPDQALAQRAHELGRATADAQLIDWLTKRSDVVKKKDILGPGVETGVYPVAPAEAFGGPKGEFIDVRAFESEKMPGLAGYYAPKEITEYITELMERPEKVTIPMLTRAAEESRGAIASFDFGTSGIQLMGALGADIGHLVLGTATLQPRKFSGIFPKAVVAGFRAFKDKDFLAKYYVDNKDVIDRWSPYMGGLRNAEYFENLQRAQTGSVSTLLKPVHFAERPFARAFESSLDVAKIEYIKSLERILGPEISAADKEVLGAWVRNSTGVLSTTGLGVSSRQQAIESTWMFFSPRYTRSLFAAVGTLLKLDKGGNEARLAIGGLVAGGLITYYGVTQALGQEMRLDPKKPGFLSIRVGDNWVGIGGGTRAMSKLFASSWEAARTNPKAFLSAETRGTDANPILSFWRSRTSPVTGTAIDIWKGEDFRGRPIEGVADWGRVLSTRVFPFALQAAVESKGQLHTRAGMGLVSGVGLNTNPMTARQVYDEYLKDVMDARGEQRFPDGADTVNSTDNEFRQFQENDPTAKLLRQTYEDERLTGTKPSREIQRVLNERADRLESADEFLDKTGDYRRYRAAVNAIRADSRKTMEDLHIEAADSNGDRAIVSEWYKTYDDPRAIDPVTGGIDSEGLESVQDEWKRENLGEWERLIEPSESWGETPHETELRCDRKFISDAGWWDSDKQAWDQLVQLITRNPNAR